METNKYSGWSDFDINKEVELRLLKEKYPVAKSIEWDNRQNVFWVESIGCTSWQINPYCSDGNLLIKLTTQYKIGLIPIGDKWLASPCVLIAMDFDHPDCDLIPQAQSDNPCRAVAECFLLIGDEYEEA